MSGIRKIDAFEILDSRGNPTIQAVVTLESRANGVAKVPSGASTGKQEAIELRDGERARYNGRGVRKAIANILDVIQPAVIGMDAGDQKALDERLIQLDGTLNKGNLGGNAILGVSLAVARAAAAEKSIPLYRHLFEREKYTVPVPMLNVLNGGRHAENNVDFQEFMIAPVGAASFAEAIRAASEIFQALKSLLMTKGYETGVGDEGGFAPRLRSNEEAMDLLLGAIKKAGYTPGTDIAINIDPAASEFFADGRYFFRRSTGERKTSAEMIALWSDWMTRYPMIWSLEDGLAEQDWEGWRELTRHLGERIQLVGDDIFVTNPSIFQRGILDGIGNSILIKLNQIGTVTETLVCIEMARKSGYTAAISHRSGETEDTAIADLAVATGVGQIKTGSVCRGERTAKYNRLLEIEHELGNCAAFAGRAVYARWKH